MKKVSLSQTQTSLLEDSLVNRSALPDIVEEQMIPATYGPTFSGWSSVEGPVGVALKMLRDTSKWASTLYSLTWSEKTTPQGHFYSQLRALPLLMLDTEYSSWPTPMNSGRDSGHGKGMAKRKAPKLPNIVMRRRRFGTPLQAYSKVSGLQNSTEYKRTNQLVIQVMTERRWPTPTAIDMKGEAQPLTEEGKQKRIDTTSGRPFSPKLRSVVEWKAPASMRLNPLWVEWLMGFPVGWTSQIFFLESSSVRDLSDVLNQGTEIEQSGH